MPHRLNQVEETTAWYENGLSFECTGCGQCCTGEPGYIWISDKELEAIATYLKIPIEDFKKQYTYMVDGRRSLLEDSKSYDCIFLEGKRCSIYSVRPTQCRTFPWWPQILQSEQSWKETAKRCEGINLSAPVVSKNRIEKELGIQQEYLKTSKEKPCLH